MYGKTARRLTDNAEVNVGDVLVKQYFTTAFASTNQLYIRSICITAKEFHNLGQNINLLQNCK